MKNNTSQNQNIVASLLTLLRILVLAGVFFLSPLWASPPIPQPDLSGANKAVKQGFGEWVQRIDGIEKADASNAKKAAVWGKFGMYLLAHDYLQQAQQALDQASSYLPLDARWVYLSGYIDSLQGNQDQAIRKWQEALELNPYYYPVMIRLGKAFLEVGELEKARQWFEKANAHAPTKAAALVGLGQVELLEGKPELALQKFQEALKLQPTATKLHFYLSQAYGALGNQEKSMQHMKMMGSQQEVAIPDALLVEVSALSRSTVKMNERAVTALQAGRLKEAEMLAKKAIDSDPENIHPQLTLAYIYAESGKHDQAASMLKKILSGKNGENPDFIYAAGVLREMAGDDTGAMQYYRKTLNISPGHGKASIALSKALMRQGKYAEAMDLNKKVMEANSENPFLPYRTAFLALALRQCEEAKSYFYKAVTMQPENFAFLTGYARAVAECGGTERELTNALNATRNMYRIKPFLPVIEVLAGMEARLGNWQAAEDYQAQALFEAAKQKTGSRWLNRLKQNFERIKQKQLPALTPQAFEEDLSPPRIKSIF